MKNALVAAGHSEPCDWRASRGHKLRRACLEGFVDQYLAALVASDPSKLPLAPSERRPRAELIRVANSYFEGMEAGTDKNTPFDKDCQRIENGVITSNDSASKSAITRMSCGAQFATGFTKVITRVRERRFPLVDEERGLVLSVIRFDHSGKNKSLTWADGTEHPVNPPFDQPFSFFIAELFKIVDQSDRGASDAGAVWDGNRLGEEVTDSASSRSTSARNTDSRTAPT